MSELRLVLLGLWLAAGAACLVLLGHYWWVGLAFFVGAPGWLRGM